MKSVYGYFIGRNLGNAGAGFAGVAVFTLFALTLLSIFLPIYGLFVTAATLGQSPTAAAYALIFFVLGLVMLWPIYVNTFLGSMPQRLAGIAVLAAVLGIIYLVGGQDGSTLSRSLGAEKDGDAGDIFRMLGGFMIVGCAAAGFAMRGAMGAQAAEDLKARLTRIYSANSLIKTAYLIVGVGLALVLGLAMIVFLAMYQETFQICKKGYKDPKYVTYYELNCGLYDRLFAPEPVLPYQ